MFTDFLNALGVFLVSTLTIMSLVAIAIVLMMMLMRFFTATTIVSDEIAMIGADRRSVAFYLIGVGLGILLPVVTAVVYIDVFLKVIGVEILAFVFQIALLVVTRIFANSTRNAMLEGKVAAGLYLGFWSIAIGSLLAAFVARGLTIPLM